MTAFWNNVRAARARDRLTTAPGAVDFGACPISACKTHFVVTRSDLPIGFLAAQVCHAAGESSPGNLDAGTHAVVLDARDEAGLLELERRLLAAGIAHVAIREPDAPHCGALTAIGLAPVEDREPARRCLSSLPLLRTARDSAEVRR